MWFSCRTHTLPPEKICMTLTYQFAHSLLNTTPTILYLSSSATHCLSPPSCLTDGGVSGFPPKHEVGQSYRSHLHVLEWGDVCLCRRCFSADPAEQYVCTERSRVGEQWKGQKSCAGFSFTKASVCTISPQSSLWELIKNKACFLACLVSGWQILSVYYLI